MILPSILNFQSNKVGYLPYSSQPLINNFGSSNMQNQQQIKGMDNSARVSSIVQESRFSRESGYTSQIQEGTTVPKARADIYPWALQVALLQIEKSDFSAWSQGDRSIQHTLPDLNAGGILNCRSNFERSIWVAITGATAALEKSLDVSDAFGWGWFTLQVASLQFTGWQR